MQVVGCAQPNPKRPEIYRSFSSCAPLAVWSRRRTPFCCISLAVAAEMAALSSFVAVVATPAQRASRPRARAVSHSHVRCGQKSEASAAAAPSAPSGVLSRRNLLASGALIASGAVQLPAFAAGADVDWASLKKDIISVIADPKAPGGVGDKGPTLVRCVPATRRRAKPRT